MSCSITRKTTGATDTMSARVAVASASPVAGGAVGRLMREYQAIQQDQIPYILVRPDDNDILTWHYVLHDLPDDTPYRGGLYHGKLVFPSSYPFAPPAIYMMTPSGRFAPNRRLCLSISDFHPETWNPSWRVETILTGLLSFMIDEDEPVAQGTVGCLTSERRRFALSSFLANKRDPVFRRLFPELLDESKFDPKTGYSLCGHTGVGGEATDSGLSPSPSTSAGSSPSPASPFASRSASIGNLTESVPAGEDARGLLVGRGPETVQTVTRGSVHLERTNCATPPAKELPLPSRCVGSARAGGDRDNGFFDASIHMLLNRVERNRRGNTDSVSHGVQFWRRNEDSAESYERGLLSDTNINQNAALLQGAGRTKSSTFDNDLSDQRRQNLGGTKLMEVFRGHAASLAAATLWSARSLDAFGNGTGHPASVQRSGAVVSGTNTDSRDGQRTSFCLPELSSSGCNFSSAPFQRGARAVDRDTNGGLRDETSLTHADDSRQVTCNGLEKRPGSVESREDVSSNSHGTYQDRNENTKYGDGFSVEDPGSEDALLGQGKRIFDVLGSKQEDKAMKLSVPTPNQVSSSDSNRAVSKDNENIRTSNEGDSKCGLWLLKLIRFLCWAEEEQRKGIQLCRYLSYLLQTREHESRRTVTSSFFSRGERLHCVAEGFSPSGGGRLGPRAEIQGQGKAGKLAMRPDGSRDKLENEREDGTARKEQRGEILNGKQQTRVQSERQNIKGGKRDAEDADRNNTGIESRKRARLLGAAMSSGVDLEAVKENEE
ncbi:putative ubiquitin conjugating enzyme E2 [Toxoplasma gondii MAS]|uniref:Putative ubiquitin conjugating enzyme E2 n=1 Tax=Toxoplasma gondii MAS TaxID=943118 RepID=A0A086QSG0_TOXGO|nr:putative ubiquitin conjugating enzyme E2 [Toxoplasma gondii MAS]